MPRPVHFEIPCNDPERSAEFFSSVFGWTIRKWDGPMPYWLVTTGSDDEPGINGGMMKFHHPEQPCVNTISVPSVDEYAAKIEAAGGQIVVPKMPIPGVGYLSYFKDLDGHIHGITETDPTAGS